MFSCSSLLLKVFANTENVFFFSPSDGRRSSNVFKYVTLLKVKWSFPLTMERLLQHVSGFVDVEMDVRYAESRRRRSSPHRRQITQRKWTWLTDLEGRN